MRNKASVHVCDDEQIGGWVERLMIGEDGDL